MQGLVFFGLTLLLDWPKRRCTASSCCGGSEKHGGGDAGEDDEVAKERERVLRNAADDILLVKNLTKYYGNQPAVRNLTFGVQPGECFGLVGLNGAGKSTTLKILTG